METNSHNRGSPQQLACYWIRSNKFLTIGYQASNQRLTLYMYIYIYNTWYSLMDDVHPWKGGSRPCPQDHQRQRQRQVGSWSSFKPISPGKCGGSTPPDGEDPNVACYAYGRPTGDAQLVTPSWWPIQHDPTVEDLIRKLLWNMLKLFKSFKAFQSLLNILGAYFSGWVPDSGQDSHQVLSEVYPWRRLAHTWCDLCCRLDAPRMMGKDMPLISTILLSFILGQLLGWILCYVMAPSLTSQHWREEKSKYIDDDGNVIKMPGADYADCCHGCLLALCSVANAREPLSVEFDNSSSVAE